MKIGWVADLTIEENRGGGQQTNHEMVISGRERGHTIDYITPKNWKILLANIDKESFRYDLFRYDLLILNRTMAFSADTKRLMISRSRRYVRYEHDYDSVWADPLCHQICEKALLNIFLSPLHYKVFNRYYMNKYGVGLDNKKVYLQPSPVVGFKESGFSGVERIKNTVIWAGNLHKFKGIDNVIKYASERKDLKFDFYLLKSMSQPAYIKLIRNLENASIIDEIAGREEMNRAYASHEYFIHLPVWAEPFGRTVLEAYLSGCKLITNSQVGMMSYGWDLENYNKIVEINNKSCSNFWDRIEGLKV